LPIIDLLAQIVITNYGHGFIFSIFYERRTEVIDEPYRRQIVDRQIKSSRILTGSVLKVDGQMETEHVLAATPI